MPDAERVQARLGLDQASAPVSSKAQETPRNALALGDGDGHVVADRGLVQQSVDLVRARQAASNPRLRCQPVDSLAVEQDGARVGPQRPREQIDQRGLASAVRPDQPDTRAMHQVNIDFLRHRQCAEILGEPARR